MAYFDALETRTPELREQALLARLPIQVGHAKTQSLFFGESLAGVDPEEIVSRSALAALPVVRKNQLGDCQAAHPPLGGLNGVPLTALAHVFASPGPIYDLDGRTTDWWRMARPMWAAGFRAGDLMHNAFAYHMTPGAWMFEGGARQLGCPVFPAGTGQTEQQLQAMQACRPAGYAGTPSFLRILLEKGEEQGLDMRYLTKAIVSGEALPTSLRDWFSERGVSVLQVYATADLGNIAFESSTESGYIVDEEVLVEIVRPGTGETVPDGEVGEVVVTTFNAEYPLIRFGTGDLSAVLPGQSPCGRTGMRLRGWLGRADQTAKVRGMFVHPGQIAAVLKSYPQITRGRLVLSNPDGRDAMILHCETLQPENGLAEAVAATLRNQTKLRGEVVLAAPGSLPNDGKVIEDARQYE